VEGVGKTTGVVVGVYTGTEGVYPPPPPQLLKRKIIIKSKKTPEYLMKFIFLKAFHISQST